MSFRDALKRSDAVVGVVKDARRLLGAVRNNNTVGRNGRLIREYLRTHDVRKLHVGAGFTMLEGWLCTDLQPRFDSAVFLDATKPFPFEDRTFDYVYSEHMIEHIPWKDGLFMLGECFRVLKPGGTVRIATPDMKVLLDLYAGAEGPVAQQYMQWITDRFLEGVRVSKPQFVINNAFTNWGHQFLYDAEVLGMALKDSGFEDVRQVATGQSTDPHLRGLESHGKYIQDEAMADFETMVFEATRPPSGASHVQTPVQ
jgi:predicted SAM-dependent methyltransferase